MEVKARREMMTETDFDIFEFKHDAGENRGRLYLLEEVKGLLKDAGFHVQSQEEKDKELFDFATFAFNRRNNYQDKKEDIIKMWKAKRDGGKK